MVHIEITSWFPSLKNQEVIDKYLAVLQDPGLPSSVKSFKILMFDVSKPDSLINLEKWMKLILILAQ